ncbi:RHS repeat-associated core domain protein [Leptospira wolffii serovar Khorat str. Khorat-H2]|nr:RHS repeat-associated core domain protein [Leptospira wolffii serovar Khorat str. Khorat-H2]
MDSVAHVLDEGAHTLSRTQYEPYGETLVQRGNLDFAPKYNSQELDRETNFYFYNARYYDPQIARFTSADTVIDGARSTQGWNRFSYVAGNPIRYKDPTGHEVLQIGLKAEWTPIFLGMALNYSLLWVHNEKNGDTEFYLGKGYTYTVGLRADAGLDVNNYSSDTYEDWNNTHWYSASGDAGLVGAGVIAGEKNNEYNEGGFNYSLGVGLGGSVGLPRGESNYELIGKFTQKEFKDKFESIKGRAMQVKNDFTKKISAKASKLDQKIKSIFGGKQNKKMINSNANRTTASSNTLSNNGKTTSSQRNGVNNNFLLSRKMSILGNKPAIGK